MSDSFVPTIEFLIIDEIEEDQNEKEMIDLVEFNLQNRY